MILSAPIMRITWNKQLTQGAIRVSSNNSNRMLDRPPGRHSRCWLLERGRERAVRWATINLIMLPDFDFLFSRLPLAVAKSFRLVNKNSNSNTDLFAYSFANLREIIQIFCGADQATKNFYVSRSFQSFSISVWTLQWMNGQDRIPFSGLFSISFSFSFSHRFHYHYSHLLT